MPPKRAAAAKAPKAAKAHDSVGLLTWYGGSVIVFASAGLSHALAQAGGDPLTVAVKMWLMNAALCLVASWFTWDFSWVDRLWSVTPIFYVVHFAHVADWTPRLTLMAGLSLAWGLRLSWNFARKAGYQVGEEDYRWPELQRQMKAFAPRLFPVLWQVFNVTFICLYQHVLLLLIALPAWVAQQSAAPLNALDAAAAALFCALLLLETVADQQQWVFQQSKRGLLPQRPHLKGDYGRGFLTRGLFAYSRHPNFFAEQSMWWAFYLFAVAAKGGANAGRDAWLQPVLIGPVLLSLLFQGSTPFTEDITLRKYPAYAEYQKKVSRLIPLPPRGTMK